MGDMTREPSMEEILSSIRRVIARDEAQRSTAPRVARGSASDSEGPDADMSGLERAADALDRNPGNAGAADVESGVVAAPADMDNDDILELTVASVDDAISDDRGADSATLPPAMTVSTMPQTATESSEPLVSTDSLAASARALETLSAALHDDAPPAGPATVGAGSITIDAMVEASLRPMLKQWLDANLPSIVERMVAREIARITGGRV